MWPTQFMRPLAALLLLIGHSDALLVSSPRSLPLLARTSRARVEAGVRMDFVDPADAAKAARELREEKIRQARLEQERAQQAYNEKQARAAEAQARAQAREAEACKAGGYGISSSDRAKSSLEAMFSLDAEEVAASEAFELASNSKADAAGAAAAAEAEEQLAARELAMARRTNDSEAAERALRRLEAAAAARAAATAAGQAATGELSSALSQQAEAAVAAAAKARSLALAAAAAAAAAEGEAEDAVAETAGYQASTWERTKLQLWGAAESVLRGEAEVAPGRSINDFVSGWNQWHEDRQVAIEYDALSDTSRDPMDALEEAWGARIRRDLDATADEVKQSIIETIQRDRRDYDDKASAASERQESLRTVGLAADATEGELATALEAVRAEVDARERAAAAREGAVDDAIAAWEARAAKRAAREAAEAAASEAAEAARQQAEDREAARAAAPLRAGWREAIAEPSGRAYYFEVATRETTWQRPVDEEAVEAAVAAAARAHRRRQQGGGRRRWRWW